MKAASREAQSHVTDTLDELIRKKEDEIKKGSFLLSLNTIIFSTGLRTSFAPSGLKEELKLISYLILMRCPQRSGYLMMRRDSKFT